MNIWLERVASSYNLRKAWLRVRSNLRKGSHTFKLAQIFSENLEQNLFALRIKLLNGSYSPQPFYTFNLVKSSGGMRPIAVPHLTDRIIQNAVLLIFAPEIETKAHPACQGSIAGRGLESVSQEVFKCLKNGLCCGFYADVENFFGSLDKKILMSKLSPWIPEKTILDLISQWNQMGCPGPLGIPQGGVLSPMLANLYLRDFDFALSAPNQILFRYLDDFLLLSPTLSKAKAAGQKAEKYLHTLRLKLKQGWKLVNGNEGFKFLGRYFAIKKGDQNERKESHISN